MSNKIKIAIDAMGGENSPKKIIDGIKISLKKNKENFFHLYGDESLINKHVLKDDLLTDKKELGYPIPIIRSYHDQETIGPDKENRDISYDIRLEALKMGTNIAIYNLIQ